VPSGRTVVTVLVKLMLLQFQVQVRAVASQTKPALQMQLVAARVTVAVLESSIKVQSIKHANAVEFQTLLSSVHPHSVRLSVPSAPVIFVQSSWHFNSSGSQVNFATHAHAPTGALPRALAWLILEQLGLQERTPAVVTVQFVPARQAHWEVDGLVDYRSALTIVEQSI
jgi:hypothetical protein